MGEEVLPETTKAIQSNFGAEYLLDRLAGMSRKDLNKKSVRVMAVLDPVKLIIDNYDSAKTDTILASVTYLNDDYRGGETIMSDGTIIPPKVGRLLIFNGMKYEHGHTMTNSGYRYTIAMWYRKEK